MRFGEELKAQREQRGISLNDVAVSTRVSLRHLHALESDSFKELPGGVFNRGIVRSYAKHCGMDVERTVQEFQRALRDSGLPAEEDENDWTEFAEAVRRSRVVAERPTRLRWLGVLGMVVAVIALAAGVFWVLLRKGVVHLPERKRIVAGLHWRS